jgi:hypothetical protein
LWLLLSGQQERKIPQNLWSQNFFSKYEKPFLMVSSPVIEDDNSMVKFWIWCIGRVTVLEILVHLKRL